MPMEMNEIFKNKELYAKEFSEGDIELEKLLLFLWKHEIETIACCAGHSDAERESYPYIAIKIKEEYIDELLKFVDNAYTPDIMISFTSYDYDTENKYVGLYKKEGLFIHLNKIIENWGKFDVATPKYFLYKKISDFILESKKNYTEFNFRYDCNLHKEICNILTTNIKFRNILDERYTGEYIGDIENEDDSEEKAIYGYMMKDIDEKIFDELKCQFKKINKKHLH